MTGTDLCFTPAVELSRLIRERKLSPVELLEALLARIEEVNPKVNAYCTLAADSARAAAKTAEGAVMSGLELGPLHGLPVSIKDLTATAGIRTTMGSKIFEHNVPADDAIIVARLKNAGALVIGKTNTPEFGCKCVTDNRIFGATRNPWNLEMVAGGSSGGAAAAVASGMGPLGHGTDLAGSVRIPAAACGVVGLKPSPGRIARMPTANAWSALAVDGPIARTVRDTALLFSAMVGFDDRDPLSLPDTREDFVAACDSDLPRLRIAWSPDFGYAPVESRVLEIAESAVRVFESLGSDVEADVPAFSDPDELFRRLTGPARAAAFSKYLDEWADQMDPILIERMRMTDDMSAEDYERLMQERTALWRTFHGFFKRFDLLVTPTLAAAPFPITNRYPPTEVAGQPVDTPTAWFPFTFPFNLTGHPAITVPAGFTPEGLPVGLQIVGPRTAEALILTAAAAFESARPWADRRPDL